jgi:hypothetical protein
MTAAASVMISSAGTDQSIGVPTRGHVMAASIQCRAKLETLAPRVTMLCLAVMFSAGCVPGRTYRTQVNMQHYCVEAKPADCSTHALHIVGDQTQSPPALIGFVEFDDLGHLRSPQTMGSVIGAISGIARRRSILIVVFAHGWKHNANATDSNVKEFKRVLIHLSKADKSLCAGTSCEGRQVVGVYLGWRGLSNRLEPFKTLTFWRRKQVAHRVGGDGAAEVLAHLGRINAKDPNNRNALLVVGHSFGSALIYESIHQGLIRDAGSAELSGRVGRGTANTVILINPAVEAARFHTLRRAGQHINPEPGQVPLLAVFTSEDDLATKLAFPLGRRVSNVFAEHVDESQRQQDTIALGHYRRFWTHLLSLIPAEGGHNPLSKPCAWLEFSTGRVNHWQVGDVLLSRLPEVEEPARYESPLWVVRVRKDLIPDHSDIWGSEFSNFLFHLLLVAAHQDTSGCTPHGLSGEE